MAAATESGHEGARDLPEAASVELLASFVKDHLSLNAGKHVCRQLALSDHLRGTRNFLKACHEEIESASLNDHLRWIDTVVCVPVRGNSTGLRTRSRRHSRACLEACGKVSAA